MEVPKTDRNQRVAVVVPLAVEEESQTDRSVRAPWVREEPSSRKDPVLRQVLRGFLCRWAVWVRVSMPEEERVAHQIYLPVEYLAGVEVVLEAVACQMDQQHLSPKVAQEVASQVKTDRGRWEPEEACQMDSRFHQAEAEVQRVLGFRKTDLCRLDPAVRAGWGEARVLEQLPEAEAE